MKNNIGQSGGFTLMELLVVVAILAILASIAVPNLLEAQTRSKVARVKADLRTMATALEAYHTDHKSYPYGNAYALAAARPSIPGDPPVLERLSTPVAYMANALVESPFVVTRFSGPAIDGLPPLNTDYGNWIQVNPNSPDKPLYGVYAYTATMASGATLTGIDRALHDGETTQTAPADAFILQCSGPTQAHINLGGVVSNGSRDYCTDLLYDPTNGSVSFGGIWRAGGTRSATDTIYGALDASGD